MTIAQINCFMEVARHQSFSKAAAQLFISQPAVSKQVSLLEKMLGVALIDRTYSTIQLTQAGKMFYDFFAENTERFHELLVEAKLVDRGHVGDLQLGCLDGWDISTFFPKMQGVLEDKYPNLHLRLNGYNHAQILDALSRGEIDVAVTLDITLHGGQSKFSYRPFTHAPVVVLFSALHPLAEKKDLSLYDFRDSPFYVITPQAVGSNAMEQLTLDVCKAAGFRPRIEHVPSSASVLLRLQGGLGVQITCEWTGACMLPLYRIMPLERELDIDAVWMENQQNPAKHIFLNELFAHYQSEEESEPEQEEA
ncbi:MAG: LysR family transcriptional regulator [Oscillospiraceae bacterium]|nr:LysR family transcriptional regulator [Oscillospiraceae bacterium]MCC8089958.1 LysR family transcriptional regulator [Oscillospiraceae bacterium]MCD7933885.1 LysR family transcriptional regulator [Oscillospiraceae bacterium]MCD8129446.1 LysR family transcriptional regulator [Oscillospiraceae bacterium]MCD8240696.1 LysR family transcriptional regulator [Oscillospiraceae bacterium]